MNRRQFFQLFSVGGLSGALGAIVGVKTMDYVNPTGLSPMGALKSVEGASAVGTDNGKTVAERLAEIDLRFVQGLVSVVDEGAKGDGVTADNAAFIAAAAKGGGRVPAGVYALNDITLTGNWVFEEGAVLKALDDGGSPITFVSSNKVVMGLVVDLNQKHSYGVKIFGNSNVVLRPVISGGVASNINTNSVYGMYIEGDNNVVLNPIVHSMFKHPNEALRHENGSMPQAIAVVGASDNNIVKDPLVYDAVSGVVLGSNTGATSLGDVICRNMVDNGIYQLGGYMKLGNFEYDGMEEGIVFKGDAKVRRALATGKCIAPVNFDNCGDVDIDEIVGRENSTGAPDTLWRVRSGNVSSGSIKIGSLKGKYTGKSIFGCQVGTVESLTIDNADITFFYDAAIANELSQFANFSAAEEFNFGDIKIKIIDKNDVLTAASSFRMKGPTTKLKRNSYLRNMDVFLYASDEVAESGADFRGEGFAQEKVRAFNANWRCDIGPYVMHSNYRNGVKDSVGGSNPAVGWFPAGTDFILDAATTAPFRTRCTVSGDNTSWVKY